MMVDLDTAIAIAKVIWPVAVWVALVNQRLKKLEHDVDYLFWKLRGGKKDGMRKRSLAARVNRLRFEVRRRINGPGNRSNRDQTT